MALSSSAYAAFVAPLIPGYALDRRGLASLPRRRSERSQAVHSASSTHSKRSGRANALLIAGLSALIAAGVATLWWTAQPIPFDAPTWKSSGAARRGRMLKDILARDLFVGFTRDRVAATLGEPESISDDEWIKLTGDRLDWSEGGPFLIVHYAADRVVGLSALGLRSSSEPFRWGDADWNQASDSERVAMAARICGSSAIAGWNREEVHQRLGTPVQKYLGWTYPCSDGLWGQGAHHCFRVVFVDGAVSGVGVDS